MSGFDEYLGDDPDYDGQMKDRQEEVAGSMMVVGCLLLVVTIFVVALLAGMIVWIVT